MSESTFDENFAAFAAKQGATLPVTESQVRFGSVTFSDPVEGWNVQPELVIDAVEGNLRSRFIAEKIYGDEENDISITDSMREQGLSVYTSQQKKEAEEGLHPFIRGLRFYNTITWKPNPDYKLRFVLQDLIEALWENRADVNASSSDVVKATVANALGLLDSGVHRVAEKIGNDWVINQWLKKAVLLSFRLNPNSIMEGSGGMGPWFDKVPNKFANWNEVMFKEAGFRAVPGALVRQGAYVAKGAILMPSFVNIGGYVGEGTMIDTWATVGSCAQIGKNCHLSGGVGIGGVLEPLQANPTIIEDDCFIGARSEVVEGVIVGKGSVLSMGVFISASTKIVDRETGIIYRGRVPDYSVVVPGMMPDTNSTVPGLALSCAVIVKRVDAQTRAKTSPNELLRDAQS